MSSMLLLSYTNVVCVVDARFKASKTVLLVRRIESAFSRIRQETLKGRYTASTKVGRTSDLLIFVIRIVFVVLYGLSTRKVLESRKCKALQL